MTAPVLIFSIVLLVISVAMIIIVAVQSKRGEGMGGAVTGNNNAGNLQRKDGKDEFFKKLTIVFGIVLVVVVLVFDILLARGIIK